MISYLSNILEFFLHSSPMISYLYCLISWRSSSAPPPMISYLSNILEIFLHSSPMISYLSNILEIFLHSSPMISFLSSILHLSSSMMLPRSFQASRGDCIEK